MRNHLIAVKAWSNSIFQPVCFAPFRVVKNGFNWSIKQGMNRPKAANRPVYCYTRFLEVGVGDSMMAMSWSGLTSIPLYISIKARNLPELTSKAHFKRLSFIPSVVCLFLYRLKTPQMSIVTRTLHFSCTHVTLDKFA